VIVRINDRGPFIKGRIIDLTPAGAKALGFNGLAPVTLSVTSGNVAHQVSTVRGGTTAGSGKVTLEKSGNGGTFSVDAKSSSGASISGTIKCDAFAPHMAEGG